MIKHTPLGALALTLVVGVACGTPSSKPAKEPRAADKPSAPAPKPIVNAPVDEPTKRVRITYRAEFEPKSVSKNTALTVLGRSARGLLMDRLRVKGASVLRRGDNIIVELPAMTRRRQLRLRQLLTRGSALEFKLVQEHKRDRPVAGVDYAKGSSYKPHAFQRDLAKLVATSPLAKRLGITSASDNWSHDGTREQFHSIFLQAKKRDDLERFLTHALKTGPARPPNVEIGFQRTRGSGWRTVLLREGRVVSGEDVATARVVFNPTTNMPEVLLSFKAEGAKRFAAITAANTGRKIAIIRDGTIHSQPILQAAIRGGQVTITLGALHPSKANVEASALVDALRGGSVPASLVEHKVEAIELASHADCTTTMQQFVQRAFDEATAKGHPLTAATKEQVRARLIGACGPAGTKVFTRAQLTCLASLDSVTETKNCL